jgi:hypothetical protein
LFLQENPLPSEPDLMPTFPQHRLYKRKSSPKNDLQKLHDSFHNNSFIQDTASSKVKENKVEINEKIHKKQRH